MTKNTDSVKPFFHARVEMAIRCRHDLTSTQRQVLLLLAMRCKKAKPTETFVSVDYIAAALGLTEKTVSAALKVMSEKKLIARHIRGDIHLSRRTILNWPLIAEGGFKRERFVANYIKDDAELEDFPALDCDESGADETAFDFDTIPSRPSENEDEDDGKIHFVPLSRREEAEVVPSPSTPEPRVIAILAEHLPHCASLHDVKRRAANVRGLEAKLRSNGQSAEKLADAVKALLQGRLCGKIAEFLRNKLEEEADMPGAFVGGYAERILEVYKNNKKEIPVVTSLTREEMARLLEDSEGKYD